MVYACKIGRKIWRFNGYDYVAVKYEYIRAAWIRTNSDRDPLLRKKTVPSRNE